jgi:hypothetical protein
MKHLLLLLLLCCATHGQAQMLLITEVEHRNGERQLNLQGFFRDTDTAYVQVYHDGELVHEEVRIYTWALSLGTYENYTIKFTDQFHRVKRLYVIELSDNQIEFVPPIELDFGTAGNLVLLKQRDGKPDFLLFDVGMSRH